MARALEEGKIGFIGAGAVFRALVSGMVSAGLVGPQQILAADRDEQRLREARERWGVQALTNREVAERADPVIMAVKPKDVAEALGEIQDLLRPGQLLISVAAGVPVSFYERRLCPGVAVIRVMPNTSCQVKESATAFCTGRYASARDEEVARLIFSSVGLVVKLPEEAMDAVTGLSGSGPAYVYFLIELLTDAGEKVGLPREVAYQLSVQTVYGAARMVKETGEEPRRLREKVMTPGGTTMAGLKAMEELGFSRALVAGVEAATRRSRELGEEASKQAALAQGGIRGGQEPGNPEQGQANRS